MLPRDSERVCDTRHKAATTNGPFSQPCHYCGGPVYDGQGWISWPVTLQARAIAHMEKRS